MPVKQRFETFDEAFDVFKAFLCDESCNDGQTDVCLHLFAWPCPKCGHTVQSDGDGMDVCGYVGGLCEPCIASN
jgi:rubrerythrin